MVTIYALVARKGNFYWQKLWSTRSGISI